VVALWVLTVVPLLIFGLLMVLISAPRVLATTWDSVGLQWKAVAEALGDENWVPAAAGLLGVVAVALPVAGSAYSLSRFGRRTGTWAWSSAGTVRFGQPALALAAVTVAAGAAFTLWPNGEYRPIQPGERGTVADIAQGVTKLASGRPALTPEREAELGGAPARAWKVGEDAPAVAPEKDDPTTATTTATTVRPAGVSTTVARSPSTTIADGPATTTTVARTTTTSPPRTTTTVP
jgi:putative peptide zinc metalloprotease protein